MSFLRNPDNLLLYYAKTPCVDSCEVYDLWIHGNGTVVFSGIHNVTLTGKVKTVIPPRTLEILKESLQNSLNDCEGFIMTDYTHSTRLTYKKHTYAYCPPEINGGLQKLNTSLEALALEIQREGISNRNALNDR